jgi:DNA-binding NtrC family response regulator
VADRQTLLVVEDDGAIRQSIAELLVDEGYSVVAVGDLRSAFLVIQRHVVTAVVLDWRLFGDTAEPILEHLARTESSSAVVLVSAARECAAVALRFGVPLLHKPLDLELLPGVIERAVREARFPRLS